MEVSDHTIDNRLSEVLEATKQGLLWLDANHVIRGCNQTFSMLMGIKEMERFIGQSFRHLLKFLLDRGEFFDAGEHDAFIEERLRAMQNGEIRQCERVRPNGKVLSVSGQPLPSGGYLYSYLDITRETRALEDVKRNTKATVVAMANFAEHRDTDTGVHVLRVARLVGQTARQLQSQGRFPALVDETFIDHVTTASILHDVGKISISDRILLKPGQLSDEERAIMKSHTTTGSQFLRQAGKMMADSRYLQFGAEIALTHHEWFDGSGYPHGLAGSDIPLAGRICALADVFDALTSRRPYKTPWSTERAITLIRQQVGSQFDPIVAEAFLEVIREREAISMVKWSDSMSVGNLHIDEQHMILIDTINQLANAESKNDRPVIAMIIDELVSYAAFHFDFEENLIKAGGYPELEQHQLTHQSFVKWVTNLREEFTFHRRKQLGKRILGYLRDWLSEHILGDDQAYRPYISGVR